MQLSHKDRVRIVLGMGSETIKEDYEPTEFFEEMGLTRSDLKKLNRKGLMDHIYKYKDKVGKIVSYTDFMGNVTKIRAVGPAHSFWRFHRAESV